MSTAPTIVMDSATVKRKIERIAWEIYERNIAEKEIFIIGIAESGYKIAEMLTQHIAKVSPIQCSLIKMEINKREPSDDVILHGELSDLDDKSVVVVDDVLNSGSTLIYGVRHILEANVKMCTTAVLVDRNHKRFPIKADVKGMSLSTSLQEHVGVKFDGDDATVYLD